MVVMLPVDTTMAAMCHVLFACCMHVHGSGCRCDYCMFFRSVDTCRRDDIYFVIYILSFNHSSRDTSLVTTCSRCYDIRYLTINDWNIRLCFYGYSLLIVAVRYVHVVEIVTVTVTLILDLIRYISCTFDNPRHVPFCFHLSALHMNHLL